MSLPPQFADQPGRPGGGGPPGVHRGDGLPEVPPPGGDYQPAVLHEGLVFTAGMTPRRDGRLVVRGQVGGTVPVAAAREAAALAARNALAAAAAAAGGLDRIERCLKLTVFIACADDFEEQSAVADGATEALEALVPGWPARSAVGVRALPGGAPVEVELVAAVRPS